MSKDAIYIGDLVMVKIELQKVVDLKDWGIVVDEATIIPSDIPNEQLEPIDSWVIANHANETIQSLANDRIIDLVYSGTGNYIDLGSINEIQAVSQEDWGLITTSSDVFSFGTLKLVSLPTWSVHKVWVGTGQIWERGRGITRLIAPYHASGTLRLSGLSTTFYVPSISTDGILPFRSFTTQRTLVHELGTGSLKKFSGAVEVATFNPEEKQLLFSFTGSATEKVTANPPEEGTQIRISGEAIPKVRVHEVFFGRIPVTGIADTDRTRSFVGSGSLKKFSGAAESITVNPEERQLLFSFTGTGSENTSVVEIASGRLFTFSSSTVVSAAAYETTGLFKLSGDARTQKVPRYKGSGSLKKFSGAAESLTVNPDERQLLFSFVGERIAESKSTTETASGNIKIYPEASDIRFIPNWNSVGGIKLEIEGAYRFAPVWIGSGSLKKFSGAAESLTFNPTEEQMLFSFTGQGSESRLSREISKGGTVKLSGIVRDVFVPNNIGSGTIFVTGDADAVRARDFVGFGSLRKLSGAAEALTFNPLEKQMLFSFTGVGADSRTSKLLSQGGTLAVRGTSGDPLLTFAEQPRVEIDITGDSIDLRVHAYQGSGRISNVNSADDAYIRAPYIGSGNVTISGIALVQVQLFQPAFTQVWII